MHLPGAVDVGAPRANATICCAFHSAKLFCRFARLPVCVLLRSQACRAGGNILGNDLHLNTCVSFLTEDINEDIRICSAAADFPSKNPDHVFVDCNEGGKNPSTLITQWFDAKHNNTDQSRLCYLESMVWTVALGIMTPFSTRGIKSIGRILMLHIHCPGQEDKSLGSWPWHWRAK